jgi:transcription elongation GreA/GreB family factor
MNPFEMVTVIVIAALIAGVLRSRYKNAGASSGAEARTQLQAQDTRIAKLEERIKALEAVVSEPQFHLKQQFRDLEGG